MKGYKPRRTRQVTERVVVHLTPSMIAKIKELAQQTQTQSYTYLTELIEWALDEKKHRSIEPNAMQREQCGGERLGSSLNGEGRSRYFKP